MKSCILAFTALTLSAAPPAAAQDIEGSPFVVDGDSLDFAGMRVRLLGIDAPEDKQTCTKEGEDWQCGADATAFLTEFVGRANVRCQSLGTDEHGRTLGTCDRDGLDLGMVMLEQGLAVAAGDAPLAYHEAEALRREHRIGLWGSVFDHPSVWREANPEKIERASVREEIVEPARRRASGRDLTRQYGDRFGCAIKGNRSLRGDWIYHLPGQEYYEATRPEELFCTEADALRAGYRRAKN